MTNSNTMRLQDYFEDITDRELLGWLRYLECQANLFADKEIEFLKDLGLGRDEDVVLDLGCGTGVFTRRLSDGLPGKKILASDANPGFVDLFRRSLQKAPVDAIDVSEWVVGVGECPDVIKSSAPRSVVLRLVLQHVREPKAFLSILKEVFPSGTQLYFIEEDDDLYLTEPRFEGLERVLEIYKRWADMVGSSRSIGRMLPSLAAEVGLKVKSLDMLYHTSANLGLARLVEYYRTSIADMPPDVYTPEESTEIVTALNSYVEANEGTAFVYYPQIFCVMEVP